MRRWKRSLAFAANFLCIPLPYRRCPHDGIIVLVFAFCSPNEILRYALPLIGTPIGLTGYGQFGGLAQSTRTLGYHLASTLWTTAARRGVHVVSMTAENQGDLRGQERLKRILPD
jgi:hypothetical protein